MEKKKFFIFTTIIIALCLTACNRVKPDSKFKDDAVTTYFGEGTDATIPKLATTMVIEDGVLLSYSGEDTDVVIPDSVTTISQTAFLESTEISSLTIGSNVETIEAGALASLIGKATLKISSDNKYYEMFDDVLVKKDGTTMIVDSIGADPGKNADVKMLNVRDAMVAKGYSFRNLESIEVGNAIIKTKAVGAGVTVESVTVFGRTVNFDDEYLMVTGNRKFQAFEVQEGFIIASIDNGGYGRTYFISANDFIMVESPLNNAEDIYSSSVIAFYKEGESAYYERIPRKFYNIQALGGIFEKCVSRDELFKETGTIVIDGGKIDYAPQKEVSVSDAVDLEREFELWCETIRLDPSKVTIDEYLQKNSSIYSLAQ